MQKNLSLIEDDDSIVKKLATGLNISELTAKVLCHRGITDVVKAEKFLDPENKQEFNDPFLMKGMSEAVDRIIKAINNKEKIVIYGDYDVDGMTSSAIMLRALRKLDATVEFYIPKREEGYGLNVPALQKIADDGANLLISVDCGISNAKEIEEIKDRFDVIVTDHHLTSDTPVEHAVAVLNPHQKDCSYPDKNLCGVGVSFKLCQALNMKINDVDYKDYVIDIDIVALGTVADIVPLVGENRKIVYLGLKQMAETENIGLHALMEVADVTGKKLNTNHLGYKIGPRLNATGRIASASKGVQLLITEDENLAKNIAQELNAENDNRKDMENRMVEEANEEYYKLRAKRGGDMSSIIVASENWHPGVIGLAAARLLEKHYLPTIVLSIQGEYSRASCRSIEALHMKDALDHFKDYFIQYGGHAAAAGFTIRTKDLEEFREVFDDYVKQHLREDDFIPIQEVDAFIHPSKLTLKLADEIEKIAPFGVENPQPIFACKNVQSASPRVIGQEQKHLSFFVRGVEGNSDVRAVSWGNAAFGPLIGNELIDITFEPEHNEFNGNASVQCMIKSISPSREGMPFPDRDAMINFYKFLKLHSDETEFKTYDIVKFSVEFKTSALANKNPKLNSTYTMQCAVQVFEELGLLQFNVIGDKFIMPRSSRKLNLNESRFWRLNNEGVTYE